MVIAYTVLFLHMGYPPEWTSPRTAVARAAGRRPLQAGRVPASDTRPGRQCLGHWIGDELSIADGVTDNGALERRERVPDRVRSRQLPNVKWPC